jgi:hypothetical protein
MRGTQPSPPAIAYVEETAFAGENADAMNCIGSIGYAALSLEVFLTERNCIAHWTAVIAASRSSLRSSRVPA